MTKISTLKQAEMGNSKGDFYTVPNQSGVKAPEIKPQATFETRPSLQLLKAISSI